MHEAANSPTRDNRHLTFYVHFTKTHTQRNDALRWYAIMCSDEPEKKSYLQNLYFSVDDSSLKYLACPESPILCPLHGTYHILFYLYSNLCTFSCSCY